MGLTSHREQHIGELDDTDDKGQPRQAVLDVVCFTHTGRSLIDISVTDAVSVCPRHTNSHARHDATAAMAREQDKRARYRDHPALIPFVFETGGRWGPTAQAFVKTHAPTDPTERSESLAQLRYNLSTSLQRDCADMMLSARN